MNIKNDNSLKLFFSEGLIGLQEYHKFELCDLPEQEHFKLLQSLEDDTFGLVITSPFWFSPNYSFKVPDSYVSQLGDTTNMDVFVVVTLASNPQDVTANLLGPIIIDKQAGKGYQVLASDAEYSTRHKLCSSSGR